MIETLKATTMTETLKATTMIETLKATTMIETLKATTTIETIIIRFFFLVDCTRMAFWNLFKEGKKLKREK